MIELHPMKLMVISLFLLAFSALASGPESCANRTSDCEYYTCVAAARHCQGGSYPLQFGRRYCLRYEARKHRFSQEGQAWINDVRSCLIREMNTYPADLTCGDLKTRAFGDHVPCYLESGYCELSARDKRQVFKAIWPSLKNIQVILAGIKTNKACTGKN